MYVCVYVCIELSKGEIGALPKSPAKRPGPASDRLRRFIPPPPPSPQHTGFAAYPGLVALIHTLVYSIHV